MLHFTYFNIQTIVWGIKPTKINASKQWRFKAPRHKRQTKSTWKLSSVYDHHGLQYKLWNVLILIKWISLWMMPWGRASLTQLVLLPMVVIHTSNIRVWLFVPTHIGIYIKVCEIYTIPSILPIYMYTGCPFFLTVQYIMEAYDWNNWPQYACI